MTDPFDPQDEEDEYLAAHILARAAKAVSHTQPNKRREFEVSAGYQLNEARARAGDGWAAWCAKYLIKLPLHEINRLLVPYNAPKKVEPPAPKVNDDWWVIPVEKQVQDLWSTARPILQEYYCEGGGCNLAGGWDQEQSKIWFKWFDPYNRGLAIPAAQWAAFLAEVAPVYARCKRDLREFQRRERARWGQARAAEKSRQRAKDQAAAAFVRDRNKALAENNPLWLDEAQWTTARTGSVWRDIMVAGESWRVLVFRSGEGWKTSLTPPRQSKFSRTWGRIVYPTVIAAKADALGFIDFTYSKGTNQ